VSVGLVSSSEDTRMTGAGNHEENSMIAPSTTRKEDPATGTYIDLAVALAGYPPLTPEQRRGIEEYLAFAQGIMAPLLAIKDLGE